MLNRSWHRIITPLVLAGLLLSGCSEQAEERAPHPESIIPSPRVTEYDWMSTERWQTMHAEDVEIAREGNVDLLLIGDSITEGWPEPLVQEYFGDYKPANFGIGGDKTENLLWRLNSGAVGKLDPEVVSLLIGVNNFGLSEHQPNEVYQGVKAVVDTLLGAFPNAKILVHGVFPYKESAEDPAREKVRELNSQIANLADRERVYYLDIGAQLVEDNGDISTEIMPDHLHLSEKGYRIWAENLKPILSDWLE